MHQAEATNSTSPINVTVSEALFLRCVLQCQNDYGVAPPTVLGLPRSIGIVVDYDYVKRLMYAHLLRDDTEESRSLYRELTYLAVKAARTRLMEIGVIGSVDPFVWWTGAPADRVKETHRNIARVAA